MRTLATALVAISGIALLAACESAGSQYDGVSRFAGAPGPYYGPGSPPREPLTAEPAQPEDLASQAAG